MNTINERNWQMFYEVRRECGFDKPEPVEVEEVAVTYRARPPGSATRKIDTRPGYTRRKETADEKPRPGEVTMKVFIAAEAKRSGVSCNTVWHRLRGGKYGVSIRRVNHRLIYITHTGPDSIRDIDPRPGEIQMKHWIQELATAEGVTCTCIYNRIKRGILIPPNKRVVNGRVTFVKP